MRPVGPRAFALALALWRPRGKSDRDCVIAAPPSSGRSAAQTKTTTAMDGNRFRFPGTRIEDRSRAQPCLRVSLWRATLINLILIAIAESRETVVHRVNVIPQDGSNATNSTQKPYVVRSSWRRIPALLLLEHLSRLSDDKNSHLDARVHVCARIFGALVHSLQ